MFKKITALALSAVISFSTVSVLPANAQSAAVSALPSKAEMHELQSIHRQAEMEPKNVVIKHLLKVVFKDLFKAGGSHVVKATKKDVFYNISRTYNCKSYTTKHN